MRGLINGAHVHLHVHGDEVLEYVPDFLISKTPSTILGPRVISRKPLMLTACIWLGVNKRNMPINTRIAGLVRKGKASMDPRLKQIAHEVKRKD